MVVGIAGHWTVVWHCQYRLEMFKPTHRSPHICTMLQPPMSLIQAVLHLCIQKFTITVTVKLVSEVHRCRAQAIRINFSSESRRSRPTHPLLFSFYNQLGTLPRETASKSDRVIQTIFLSKYNVTDKRQGQISPKSDHFPQIFTRRDMR